MTEGKRNNSYAALRKLESGENKKSDNFTPHGHVEENVSPLQSAERLADYFSKISQEFQPICTEKFPPWIKDKLKEGINYSEKPILEEYEVFDKLSKANKPNSTVPGDLPVKLVKEFLPELAVPITRIYNKITQTAEYPHQWVTKYQLAIPKVYPALSEDKTRNIASTSFFSKQYESFIGD